MTKKITASVMLKRALVITLPGILIGFLVYFFLDKPVGKGLIGGFSIVLVLALITYGIDKIKKR